MRIPAKTLPAVLLCLILFACTSARDKARLAAAVQAANLNLQKIDEVLKSLDAAAAPPESESLLDTAPEDWWHPSEVILIQLNHHEEIDRSDGARRVSAQLRSLGSTNVNLNGRHWTVVPGGMKRDVWDYVAVKIGGPGPRRVWDDETLNKMILSAAELGKEFASGLASLKKAPGGNRWISESTKRCEAGASAAEQLSGAGKEILPKQPANVDEKPMQAGVERILKARGVIQDAVSGYREAIKQLSQTLTK